MVAGCAAPGAAPGRSMGPGGRAGPRGAHGGRWARGGGGNGGPGGAEGGRERRSGAAPLSPGREGGWFLRALGGHILARGALLTLRTPGRVRAFQALRLILNIRNAVSLTVSLLGAVRDEFSPFQPHRAHAGAARTSPGTSQKRVLAIVTMSSWCCVRLNPNIKPAGILALPLFSFTLDIINTINAPPVRSGEEAAMLSSISLARNISRTGAKMLRSHRAAQHVMISRFHDCHIFSGPSGRKLSTSTYTSCVTHNAQDSITVVEGRGRKLSPQSCERGPWILREQGQGLCPTHLKGSHLSPIVLHKLSLGQSTQMQSSELPGRPPSCNARQGLRMG